jgi:hypothetical protein
MKSVRSFLLVFPVLALAACDQEPVKSTALPPPLTQGVQAFVQVDNDHANPGDRVNVYVQVQLGTETQSKIGSYTGRLTFDPEALTWVEDAQINDGLRVTNPNGAKSGEIRFAGAAASGFTNLALYRGTFEVKKAGYMSQLQLKMEELSAAKTLGNLRPQLQVTPQIFLRAQGL